VEAICQSKLQVLELSDNQIGREGAMLISIHMRKFK